MLPYAFPYPPSGQFRPAPPFPRVDANIINAVDITSTQISSPNIATGGSPSLGLESIVTAVPSNLMNSRTLVGSGDIQVNDTGPQGNLQLSLQLANVGSAGTANFPSSVTTDDKGRVTGFGATSNNLQAIHAIAAQGLLVHAGSGSWVNRQILGANAMIDVTNPAGIAGHVTINVHGLPFTRASKVNDVLLNSTAGDGFAVMTKIEGFTTAGEFDNLFLTGFDTTLGEYTVPAAGIYRIVWRPAFLRISGQSCKERAVIRRDSGTAKILAAKVYYTEDGDFSTEEPGFAVIWEGRLAAADVIAFYAGQFNSAASPYSLVAAESWIAITNVWRD